MASDRRSVTGPQTNWLPTEHVLAHKLPDEVEAAYLHGAYLEKRKALMANWAEWCIPFMR